MAIKYYLGDNGWKGEYGEIPSIWLDYKENLLPINKVHTVHMRSLRDNLQESELRFLWLIGEKGIIVKTECQLKDERLKKQLKENNKFEEQLVEWVVGCDSPFRKKYDDLKINEVLSEAEIPENLRPYVNQVKKWKEFINLIKEKNVLNQRYGSVLKNDYYYAVVYPDAFRISLNNEKLRQLFDSQILLDLMEYSSGPFDFDPEKQPPNIDDNCIWWELPKKMVRIILPHDFATEVIVKYYKYQEVYQKFLSDREAEREAAHKRSIAYSKESAEERKKEEEKLHKALLL